MATARTQAEPSSAQQSPAPQAEVGGAAPPRSRLTRLWQFPLLLISTGLFVLSAYKLIDPKPPPTIDERLAAVDRMLEGERAEPAAETLRAMIVEENKQITPLHRGQMHLALARAIEQIQNAKRLEIPLNFLRIIDHSKQAEKLGVKLDAVAYRRVGSSYESLGRIHDALDFYNKAIAADHEHSLPLQRKVIDLLIGKEDTEAVETHLKTYLAEKHLSPGERAWALGEQSRILVDRGEFSEAKELIEQALHDQAEPLLLGQLHYRLGYCHWRLGNDGEAERYLRLARDQLRVKHPQDADAALLLGKILQKQGKHGEAISFFQDVIVNHPDSPASPRALLGRGVSRIESGNDEPGLADLNTIAGEVIEKPNRQRYKTDVLAGLRQGSHSLSKRGNLSGALELMALEQTLEPTPTAEFFGRLSQLYERRAEQLEKSTSLPADSPQQIRKAKQVRDLVAKAGDAAIAQSRGLTLVDDRGYGEALWRGIDLYDRAGVIPEAIGALELFIAERPDDPLTPDALLRLGKAFHASGQFDKAIAAFQKNQFRYPQSLAASKSGVPLAEAYLAKGPEFYGKAEWALNNTLQNPVLTPQAEEFRQALFELAQLNYRTGRFEQAVPLLNEMTERYPRDERMGHLLFLMADSFRKSADLLKAEAAKQPANNPAAAPGQQMAGQAERLAARRERLGKARRLYDGVIDHYRDHPAASDLDRLYLKLSHFYRADCVFDVGNYEEAIRLYDAAALRYQDDPSALAAYIQIVNAYAALGRPQDAKAANERARWLLQRIPAEGFKELYRTMPAGSWEQWMNWSKQAALW
jgi:tetratricopeptide (TPR) repeat protein